MHRLPIFILLTFFMTGCAAIPFEKPLLASLGEIDALTYSQPFQSQIPATESLLTAVVFKGWGRSFASLGMLRIDREQQTFLIAGLNQMGIKIFELAGDQQKLTRSYVMPQIPQPQRLAQAMAADIRHIYLDWIPPATAEIKKTSRTVIFKDTRKKGTLHYTYGGPHQALLDKKFYDKTGRLLWKAAYYEYQPHQDKLYPGGIILKNYQYGYRLTITLKEVRS